MWLLPSWWTWTTRGSDFWIADRVGRTVGGTVVHHEKFQIVARLVEHAGDRQAQRVAAAKGGENDRDQRMAWRPGAGKRFDPSGNLVQTA